MKNPIKYCISALISGLVLFTSHVSGQSSDPDIVTNKTAGCAPEAFTFTVNNAPAGKTFLWIIGGDTIRNGSESQTYLFTGSGSYDVEVLLLESGKVPAHIKKTGLVKLGKPNENIALAASRSLLCYGPDTVRFSASAEGAQQWDWIIDGTNYINAGPSVTHRFTTPGTKTVIIRTKDSMGCYALKTFDAIVEVKSPPSVDFAASVRQGCVPLQVMYTPQIKAGASPIVSYKWILPGSNIESSASAGSFSATYSHAGSFDATLQVTTQDGCVFTVLKDDYISPGSVVAPSYTIQEDNTCGKALFVFKNTSKEVPGQEFVWTAAGGTILPGSNDSAHYVKYDRSGTYTVTLTAKSGNCSRSFSQQVTATASSVSADFYADMDCGCRAPDTITFIPVLDSTAGNLSYSWTFLDEKGSIIATSSEKSPAIVFHSFGTYDAALKVTLPNGCSDSIYRKAAVSLHPIDTAQIVIQKSIGCAGDEFTFAAPPVSPCNDKAISYEWTYYDKDTNNVLAIHKGTESKMRYSETGNYNVSLKIKTANGCEVIKKLTDAVTVVEPKAYYIMDSVYGCIEGTVTLKHKTSHPGLKFSYQWELTHSEDSTLKLRSTDRTYRPVFKKPGLYTINYRAEYEGGCEETFVQKGHLFVSGVTGAFQADKTSGCLPFSTQLKSSVTENLHYKNSNPAVQYQWSASPAEGVSFSDATASNPSITIHKAGCYSITLRMTNSVGCVTTITKESYLCAGVKAGFDMPTRICSEGSVKPRSNSINAAAYRWSVEPAAIVSGANDAEPVITFPATGIYKVKLTVYSKDSCVDSITKTIVSEKPEALFTSADTINYCAPAYVSFTASGMNADSFYWYFGDGESLVTADTSIAHIYKYNSGDMSTGFDVMLVVKSKLGCTDTLLRKKYIKVLGPIPAFDMTNNTGCEPLKVEFANKSKYTTRWYLDYGDKSRIDTLVFGPQVYKVRDEDAEFSVYKPRLLAKGIYGCTAWAEAEDSVIVYRRPKAGFTVSSETGCWPYKVKFTDTSTLSFKQYWDFNNDGKIDASGKNPQTVLEPGTYNVKLIVENRFGCRDSIVMENAVTVYPNAVSSIESADTVCVNTNVPFIASSEDESLVLSYRWAVDGRMIEAANSKTMEHVFTAPGAHQVEAYVMGITGCEQIASKHILVPDTNEIKAQIRYVTVDDNSNIRIEWAKPASPFASSYTLSRENNEAEVIYQSASLGRTNYTDADVDAVNQSYTYGLQNADICGKISGPDKHSSVWLTVKPEGKNTLQVSWTPYKGWKSVKTYKLYRADAKGNFQVLAELGGNDTSYTEAHLCDKVYTYVVEALHPAGSYFSRSNTSSAKPVYEPQKEGENVLVATVLDNENIKVTWTNTYSHTSYYVIDRLEQGKGWKENYAVSQATEYEDRNVSVHEHSYAYRVRLANECYDLSEAGTFGKSILLTAKAKNEKIHLAWSRYDYWKSGVSEYRVELLLPDGYWKLLNVVPGSDTTYTDEETHPELAGAYTYRVTAVENTHTPQQSQSNRAKAMLPSHVFVPDVFTPNADMTNDVFAPKTFSIYETGPGGNNSYQLSIYNRWGERVFETNKLNEGWDGTFKGAESPEGAYIYIINAMGYDSQFYYLKGSFTLLK